MITKCYHVSGEGGIRVYVCDEEGGVEVRREEGEGGDEGHSCYEETKRKW